MRTPTTPTPPLRAAFYGHTTHNAPPERIQTAMTRQYRQCQRVLPNGALVAAFFDPKTDHPHPPTSHNPQDGGLPAHPDGGLTELLTEAGWPYRPRFDFVIACGTNRLTPDPDALTTILRHLALAGVEFLVAPWTTKTNSPLPMPYLRCRHYLDVFTTLIQEGTI